MIKLSKNNMDFFNTSFYDKASVDYSKKRYEGAPQSFIQFFFQRRLKHVLWLVGKYCKEKNNQILIEDGCADGIVARAVGESYKENFTKIIGTDISPGMIERACSLNKNPIASYLVKSEISPDVKADVLLAVGFVSPGIFTNEFDFIKKHLESEGICIISLASKNSPYARLKLKDKEITSDYWTFKKYEEFLAKDFTITDSIPYGLFIPKLWALPFLARRIQPILEVVFKPFPILFHETLYVIKQKR